MEDVVLVMSGAELNPSIVLHQTANSLHVSSIVLSNLNQRTNQRFLESRHNQSLHFSIVRNRKGFSTS